MKNFKKIFPTIIIDFIYCLSTFFISFVIYEYLHDPVADFERFKFMHSITKNIYDLLGLLIWVVFTIFIIKYNKKFIGNKKLLNLKILITLIFLLTIGFAFSFLKNPTLKNLSVTEELTARFKAIDKNSTIQNQDYGMWWDNNEGYSIIASTSESILVAKDFSSPGLESNMIPDGIFKRELAIVKTVFTDRGFILNKNNSSARTDDQKFYDYVQAYEKDNYLCTVTISAEASSYPGSGKNGKAEMGYLLFVSCTDKLAEAEVEQIPFLDALNLKNKEEVAQLINSEGDYFHVETHFRRAGSAVILKKENGNYRVLLISQEAPRCSLVNKEKIPLSVLTSIGGGDCYANDGAYVTLTENSKNQETPNVKNTIIETEQFTYSLKDISASVSQEIKPFDFTAPRLKSTSEECGTKQDAGYFDKLIAKFNGTTKIVYNFKYQGDSQDDGIFMVTLLPNKAGYTSLDQFKKDFDQCFVAGDAYPLLLNNNWLLFVNSCTSGVDDGSGRPHGCGELQEIVEPSLKLK